MKKLLIGLILIFDSVIGYSQNKIIGEPMIVDSSYLSKLIIPVAYNPTITGEGGLLINHYANILFYDPKTDSAKPLFLEDTYIKKFQGDFNPIYCYHNNIYSSKWIFYFVKTFDYNKNGKIDLNDPYTLWVSDKNGNELKSITQSGEWAASIDIYDKQGFALIKIISDTDGNRKFGFGEWDNFYYIRLDLKTLDLKKKIDIKY
jgi:hypothetical protein